MPRIDADTQVGPDGQRYPTGSVPTETPVERQARNAQRIVDAYAAQGIELPGVGGGGGEDTPPAELPEVTGFTAEPGGSTVDMEWDDVGADGYIMFKDGVAAGAVIGETSGSLVPGDFAEHDYSVAAITVGPESDAEAVQTGGTLQLDYTGSAQTWEVPAGVTSVTVDAHGAQAGGSQQVGDGKANGGRVKCDLTVTPGETLQINVGGQGGTSAGGQGTAGFNGGGVGGLGAGGGGGATDVRRGAYALADRLVVAPGAGGTGGNGTGGAATGHGGTPNGSAGFTATTGEGGGLGGTSSAGGARGTGDADSLGSAGSLGSGGAGGVGVGVRGGGGGGGGRYGGGGGGGSTTPGQAGGGGGGGSGLSTGVNETLQTGVRSGNGSVTLTW